MEVIMYVQIFQTDSIFAIEIDIICLTSNEPMSFIFRDGTNDIPK
jgi:hypothetical protein